MWEIVLIGSKTMEWRTIESRMLESAKVERKLVEIIGEQNGEEQNVDDWTC